MDEGLLNDAAILIVDDQETNVTLLTSVLEAYGFRNLIATTSSSQVLELCATRRPDLVLLDFQMPPPDGLEVLGQLEAWRQGPARLPVVMLTADSSRETRQRALAGGASDFLNKPFDPSEVVLRIRNLLTTRLLQQEVLAQNRLLEERVRERTRDLEDARLEIVDRLALASEYRDDSTGQHTQRVGALAERLAGRLGLDDDVVELIRRAAPLHDVGKLGIPDAILLKPGRLTAVEFEVMKTHVPIGSEILGRSRSALLQMSEEIARTHHERWDGSGYPEGLRGEAIPVTGRIVAVSDVFDAMTHERPYQPAHTVEEALDEIRRLAGREFDPRVVEALVPAATAAEQGPSIPLHLVAEAR